MAHEDRDALRITLQHRDRRGMVYDLKAASERLSVTILEREQGSDWSVEARSSNAADALVVRAHAGTRRDALARVADEWALHARSNLVPTFDWSAVVVALDAVRAL